MNGKQNGGRYAAGESAASAGRARAGRRPTRPRPDAGCDGDAMTHTTWRNRFFSPAPCNPSPSSPSPLLTLISAFAASLRLNTKRQSCTGESVGVCVRECAHMAASRSCRRKRHNKQTHLKKEKAKRVPVPRKQTHQRVGIKKEIQSRSERTAGHV